MGGSCISRQVGGLVELPGGESRKDHSGHELCWRGFLHQQKAICLLTLKPTFCKKKCSKRFKGDEVKDLFTMFI